MILCHAVDQTRACGFREHELRVCFVTDHPLCVRIHKYRVRSEQAVSGKRALSLKELRQFEGGDCIGHIDHGVGKFGGLFRAEHNGPTQADLTLIFQLHALLYVSLHALQHLAKYQALEGELPRSTHLGPEASERSQEKHQRVT